MEQNRNRGSPRLLFSKEELDNPALSRPAKKAAKAADKYEAAQKKLPTRHRLRLTREEIETGQAAVETADAEPAMPQSPAAASNVMIMPRLPSSSTSAFAKAATAVSSV